jgi:UDP-glucuronate decarboxylase
VKNKMNVLITGAAGFLGSHLMFHHLKKGDNVLGLDNFSSSKKDSKHIRLLHELYSPNRFSLCDVDITEYMDILWEVEKFNAKSPGNFDLIYNFACPASPPRYQEIPVETVLVSTIGVANVLQLAKKQNSVVVHASTSEVYGDPIVSPQPETYRGNVNSYGPRACYDEGKRAAEALCYDFLNKHSVDVRVVRIFNTYGPHMDAADGRVITNFIMQAMKGESFTIYGHGRQTRSFCYVDDLIRGIVSLARLKKNPGTPINLGNPGEFTINHLVSVVNTLINPGTQPKIQSQPMPVDDPSQRKPDITLAKQYLDWSPQTSLVEGLSKTIEYFRDFSV